MGEDEGFEDDDVPGGSYSRLLFGDDDVVSLDFSFSSLSNDKSPKMLCFGNYQSEGDQTLFSASSTRTSAPQRSGVICSDSSSASSGNNTSKLNRKRNGSGQELAKTVPATQKTGKKAKAGSTANVKARKEKLGERITALQQLVSPFGKTDTASVLHEAMGYIRFLHEQVEVLCSPYLQSKAALSSNPPVKPEGGEDGGESGPNLRTRGLCLVPVACTMHVAADTNGADFWSPAMAMGKTNNVTPSTEQ